MDATPAQIVAARNKVATEIAHQRAAHYLIAPYLRGELDNSVAIECALAELYPRCPVTGQPLSPQQQYERDCG